MFLGHITLIFLYLPEPSSYLPHAQAAGILGSLSKLWAGVEWSAPLHTALSSIRAWFSECKKLLREIILVFCFTFLYGTKKQEIYIIELGEGETSLSSELKRTSDHKMRTFNPQLRNKNRERAIRPRVVTCVPPLSGCSWAGGSSEGAKWLCSL